MKKEAYEFSEMVTTLTELMRINMDEQQALSNALECTSETHEEYGVILDNLAKLQAIHDEQLEDLKTLLTFGEKKWKRVIKTIGRKMDEVDINKLIGIAGMSFVIMLLAHYEKNDEEPVIFRGKGASFIGKTNLF